jgi:hypothetical protein
MNIVGRLATCQRPARARRGRSVTAIALLPGILFGCATVSERYESAARAAELTASTISGVDYSHRVFARPSAEGGGRVRVYLEGDGTPWLRGRVVAADPTPRRPFAIELLRRDAGSALLVGRPCYHGGSAEPPCRAEYWTDARYANAVVESLAVAITRAIGERAVDGVTLVGYSGGGALAVLVAERLPAVDRVLTIAANLDLEAWTRLHGYRPLVGSLDPARRERTRAFEEIHLVGERDRNVPPTIAESYAAAVSSARIERFPFDHTCCWVEAWPELLARLDPP